MIAQNDGGGVCTEQPQCRRTQEEENEVDALPAEVADLAAPHGKIIGESREVADPRREENIAVPLAMGSVHPEAPLHARKCYRLKNRFISQMGVTRQAKNDKSMSVGSPRPSLAPIRLTI